MIPLLEEMFTDSEEDNFAQDSMPNLVFNDNEEWENVPNSNEIPSDDSFTTNNMPRTVSSSLISSVSSSVISWFKPQTK